MIKRLVIISLSLVVLLLAFTLPARVIRISNIECSSQYGDCPDDINSRLQGLRHKSLIEVKKGATKVLRDNFLISDFSTQFKLPSSLKMNLVIKKAMFALKQKDTNNYALVDKSGYVVAIADNSNLPTVIIDEKLKNVGEVVNDNNLLALKFMSGVFNMYQINVGEVKNNNLVVELPSALTVIFPLAGDELRDSDFYLGVLRLITTKIETENTGIYREIDLRFKNPVLR